MPNSPAGPQIPWGAPNAQGALPDLDPQLLSPGLRYGTSWQTQLVNGNDTTTVTYDGAFTLTVELNWPSLGTVGSQVYNVDPDDVYGAPAGGDYTGKEYGKGIVPQWLRAAVDDASNDPYYDIPVAGDDEDPYSDIATEDSVYAEYAGNAADVVSAGAGNRDGGDAGYSFQGDDDYGTYVYNDDGSVDYYPNSPDENNNQTAQGGGGQSGPGGSGGGYGQWGFPVQGNGNSNTSNLGRGGPATPRTPVDEEQLPGNEGGPSGDDGGASETGPSLGGFGHSSGGGGPSLGGGGGWDEGAAQEQWRSLAGFSGSGGGPSDGDAGSGGDSTGGESAPGVSPGRFIGGRIVNVGSDDQTGWGDINNPHVSTASTASPASLRAIGLALLRSLVTARSSRRVRGGEPRGYSFRTHKKSVRHPGGGGGGAELLNTGDQFGGATPLGAPRDSIAPGSDYQAGSGGPVVDGRPWSESRILTPPGAELVGSSLGPSGGVLFYSDGSATYISTNPSLGESSWFNVEGEAATSPSWYDSPEYNDFGPDSPNGDGEGAGDGQSPSGAGDDSSQSRDIADDDTRQLLAETPNPGTPLGDSPDDSGAGDEGPPQLGFYGGGGFHQGQGTGGSASHGPANWADTPVGEEWGALTGYGASSGPSGSGGGDWGDSSSGESGPGIDPGRVRAGNIVGQGWDDQGGWGDLNNPHVSGG